MSIVNAWQNIEKKDEEEKKVVGQQQKTQSDSNKPTGTTSIPKNNQDVNGRTQNQSTSSSLRTENNITTASGTPKREESKQNVVRRNTVTANKQEQSQNQSQNQQRGSQRRQQTNTQQAHTGSGGNYIDNNRGNNRGGSSGTWGYSPEVDAARSRYASDLKRKHSAMNLLDDIDSLPDAKETKQNRKQLDDYLQSARKQYQYDTAFNDVTYQNAEGKTKQTPLDLLQNVAGSSGAGAMSLLGDIAGIGDFVKQKTSSARNEYRGFEPNRAYEQAMNAKDLNADFMDPYNAYKDYVADKYAKGEATNEELQNMVNLEMKYMNDPLRQVQMWGNDARASKQGYQEANPIASFAGDLVNMYVGNNIARGAANVLGAGKMLAPIATQGKTGLEYLGAQLANGGAEALMTDLPVQRVPELLRNINEGKSAGETAKDLGVGLLGDATFNGVFNVLGDALGSLFKNKKAIPEVEDAVKAVDTPEVVEQAAKNADNVIPDEQILRNATDINYQNPIENIMPDVPKVTNKTVGDNELGALRDDAINRLAKQGGGDGALEGAYTKLVNDLYDNDVDKALNSIQEYRNTIGDNPALNRTLQRMEDAVNGRIADGITPENYGYISNNIDAISDGLDRIRNLDGLSELGNTHLNKAYELLDQYEDAVRNGGDAGTISKELNKTLGNLDNQAKKVNGYDGVFSEWKGANTARGDLYSNTGRIQDVNRPATPEEQSMIDEWIDYGNQNRYATPANQIPKADNVIPDAGATPKTDVPKNDIAEAGVNASKTDNIAPEIPEETVRYGNSRVVTNTAKNADIVTAQQIKDDPIVKDIMRYEKHSNAETLDNAIRRIDTEGTVWKDDFISGKKAIADDTDVDTAMLLMQDLNKKIDGTKDAKLIEQYTNEKNALLRKLREFGTKSGQNVQSFAKWNNTADGAMLTATKVQEDDIVKPWKTKNAKTVKGNSRIAQALAEMGNDTKRVSGNGKTLTHDQIKEGVLAEIEKEFGSVEDIFTDNDLEYLARLAEDKEIPVWKITDEIEHRLNHGTWYTLDEALPEKTVKNKQISRMLDNIINGKKAPKEKAEQTIGELLTGIKNTLNDESIGVADKFTDDDVYFLSRLIQEDVPKWQIEDELAHKLNTGSWYAIDESIEAPRPINQKLNNALKAMFGEGDVKAPKAELSLNEIREQVKNTLEREVASFDGEFTDSDIDYLANLISNGSTKQELTDALNIKMATGSFGISPETQQQVNDLFKQAQLYDPNSKQFVECQAEALRLLAEEVAPNATPLEKFETWRYMAMLGNPKTMFRNYVGNKMFGIVTGISNNIAAIAEEGVDRTSKALGGEGIQRTKSVLNPISDKKLIDASALDADTSRYRQMMGSKYEKVDKDTLKQHRSVFKSKIAQLGEKAVDAGISDYSAIKNKYSTSLAGYLKANGYDASIFDADTQLRRLKNLEETQVLSAADKKKMEELTQKVGVLEKARDYALNQAEYATFHEDNAFASWLSNVSNNAPGVGRAIIEGVIPFKKTPANVLKSGIQYSPLGAIDSIKKTGKLIYENTGKRAGNLADTYINSKGKEVTKTLASDVIESWSKTLTGTGMTALGAYLYDKGIVQSSNNDTKYQDQLEGLQNYSIKINGKTYTIDWAAPAVMPILLGAEIKKVWDSAGETSKKWYENLDEYLSAANRIADPLVEMSFVQGIFDTIETAANAVKNDDLMSIPAMIGYNAATGYLQQAIPTLSGQIARTVDNTRRSTYTDKEGVAGVLEKQGKKLMNKIPFLSEQNEPYIDTYGREQKNAPTDNPFINFAYQSMSPGYLADVNTTEADKLSRELYEKTGDDSILPAWQSSVKVDGERVSPETYTQFAKVYGETNYKIRDELANNEWFNGLSDEDKAEIFHDINNLSKNMGQAAINENFTSSSKPYEAYSQGGTEGLIEYYKGQMIKSKANESGLAPTSKASKEIQADLAAGNDDAAQAKIDAAQELNSLGIDSSYAVASYYKAADTIQDLTPAEFADTFKSMDTDGNQSLKQDEVIEYLNNNKITSQSEADKIWEAYGKDWKSIPSLIDGEWTTKKSKSKTSGKTTSNEIKPTSNNTLDAKLKAKQKVREDYQKNKILTPEDLPTAESTSQTTASDDGLNWSLSNGYNLKNTQTYQRAQAAGVSDNDFLNAWNAADTDGNGYMKKAEAQAYVNALPKDEQSKWFNILYKSNRKGKKKK